MKNLTLKFFSSIAIQYCTLVICENVIQQAAKFTNSQKISPSKILGYTVYTQLTNPGFKIIYRK